MQFRAEASNILNKVNFGNPQTTLGPLFGQIISTAVGPVGDPRIIQLAAKYVF